MIGIIDLDLGNLRSVSNAVYNCGFDFQIIRNPPETKNTTHLILPGVGSYKNASRNLDLLQWRDAIHKYVQSGRPFLGICLGMQLLAESGTEGGISKGLGLIPGQVTKLPEDRLKKIPHIGWNSLKIHTDHAVFSGIKDECDYYHVHSYYFETERDNVAGSCEADGFEFTTVVAKQNVLGFQFHPEKSQVNGLRLLENFCDWDGKC